LIRNIPGPPDEFVFTSDVGNGNIVKFKYGNGSFTKGVGK
jgi:hypothetical protein